MHRGPQTSFLSSVVLPKIWNLHWVWLGLFCLGLIIGGEACSSPPPGEENTPIESKVEDVAPDATEPSSDRSSEPALDREPSVTDLADSAPEPSEPISDSSLESGRDGEKVPEPIEEQPKEDVRDVTRCTTACDCATPFDCINGVCARGPKPVYCCESAPCPKGQICADKSGGKAQCGGGACQTDAECGTYSCQTVGGACQQKIALCVLGACEQSEQTLRTTSCDATRGLCVPNTCSDAQSCGNAGCIDVSGGCLQYQPFCQEGACISKEQELRYGKCNAILGQCEPAPCSRDADCGPPICRQSGAFCEQTSPKCDLGKCTISTSNPTINARCNPLTGRCEPAKGCTQASDCVPSECTQKGDSCAVIASACNGGLCRMTTYTLDLATCGQGKCSPTACTQDGDCGTSTCFTSGSLGGCVQQTPTCVDKVCTILQRVDRSKVCNLQNQRCETPKTCTQDSDCGKSSCVFAAARGCTAYTPTCQNGTCTVKQTTDVSASCQASTGLCTTQTCTATADCGGMSCRQEGEDCAQIAPQCSGGTCHRREQLLVGYNCSRNGICERSCQTQSDCSVPTCQETGLDCTQVASLCINGTCSTSRKFVEKADCFLGSGLCVARKACQKDADCGFSDCRDENTGVCRQNSVACTNGFCDRKTKLVRGSACNPLSGQCSAPQSCTQDSDCQERKCLQAGSNCYQTALVCEESICVVKTVFLRNSFCGNVTGLCSSPQCTQNSDCGPPSCRNDGPDCLGVIPSCDTATGGCRNLPVNAVKSTCDTNSRICVPTQTCQQDGDCGMPACSDDAGTCSQLTPICLGGVCTISTHRGPGLCHGNSGTCRFSGASIP